MALTLEIKNAKKGLLKKLDDILSIDVMLTANRLPIAEIVLLDGDVAQGKFPLSDTGFFDPGEQISISARRKNGAMTKLFTGFVISQTIEVMSGSSRLCIELTDKAHAMTMRRQSFVYRKKSDSDVISKLAGEAGLSIKKVEKTITKYDELVQYNCSDWDFCLSRAEANGLILLVSDGTLSAVQAKLGSQELEITYGISNVLDIELKADARNLYGSVKGFHYDAKKRTLSPPADSAISPATPGTLRAPTIAKNLGVKELHLVSPVAGLKAEVEAWAKGAMIRSRLSLIQGRIRVEEEKIASLGSSIKLTGCGKVFNGKAFVSGVRHSIQGGTWTTDYQLGLSSETLVERTGGGISNPLGSGLLPGVQGLQIGTVESILEDPGKEFRVKVKLLGLNQADNMLWARLALPDAGKKRGFNFMPEKDDEVVVGFLNGDPRQPIILGSLYSSGIPPHYPPKKENNFKGLISRMGMGIVFDDKELKVALRSNVQKEEQLIIINKKNKSIHIIDNLNKNNVKLDNKGITLASGKDMIIDVKGDFKLNAKGKVNIKGAKTDII
jgi:Rhs element Vgr protein